MTLKRAKHDQSRAQLAAFLEEWIGRVGGARADWPQLAERLLAECEKSEREALRSRRSEGPRWDHVLIEDLIPTKASVLDLGCGNGELLARLIRDKSVYAQGLEIDPHRVAEAVSNGVPVLQGSVNEDLAGFPDNSFDFVVLEKTLQAVNQPAEVLRQMLRIGKRGIVSFPNFGHWRIRAYLAAAGRMPVTQSLPQDWYQTSNIHLFSIADFLALGDATNFRVIHGFVLADGRSRPYREGDNLRAEEALFVVSRGRTRRKGG